MEESIIVSKLFFWMNCEVALHIQTLVDKHSFMKAFMKSLTQ